MRIRLIGGLALLVTESIVPSARSDVAPFIVTQPANTSATAGEIVSFNVVVTGTPPLSYFWYFNSNRLDGATNATLSLTNAQIFQSGDYHLIVSNTLGAATSSVATLTVSFRQNFLWVRQAGSSNDYEEAHGVAADAVGNLYVAGEFRGTATFGTNTLVAKSDGWSDMFLAKYTKNGDLLWVRQVGGVYDDGATGVVVDKLGNVYVTGYFESNVAFGSFTLTNYAPGLLYSDIFVAKYDSNGTTLWATNAGGGDYDYGAAIALDQNGNPIITGYFQATGHFGAATFAGYGQEEFFMASMDASGSDFHAVFASSSRLDRGQGVTVDGAGRIFTGGFFQGPTLNFFQGSVVTVTNPFTGIYTPFFARFFFPAGLEWVRVSTNVPIVWDMAPAGTNGFYAAGNSFALARIDAEGNTLWSVAAGGDAPSANARGLASDSAGNLYLAGTSFGTNISFPGITLSNGPTTNIGVIACYNTGGAFRWAKQFGGYLGSPKDITADPAGNLYTVGSFKGTADFGTNTLTSAGGADIFVAKLGVRPPVIVEWPNSTTVLAGTSNTFTVVAAGDDLTYQWQFDSTNISGATNRNLFISPAQIFDRGSYSVVVSNVFGVATSPAARLNVLTERPHIQPILISDNLARISWNAAAGQSYRLQYKSNWSDIHWNDLLPGVIATNTTAVQHDFFDHTGQRYYRVLAH